MLSKLFAFLAALCITCAAFANEGSQPSFEPFTGKITGTKVRIRTQPRLEAHVVRETHFGEMFGVVGEQDGFFLIQPPKELKGYVFRTFVLDNVVEGDNVNVRLYPDIESPVIGKLHSGDKVNSVVCENNNKWLEIDIPKSSVLYVAKDFCEKSGPIELLAQFEARRAEANHRLSALFLYTQSEIQKPFQQIDFDTMNARFQEFMTTYSDLPMVHVKVQEAHNLVQEIYVQKKVAFLENKADGLKQMAAIDPTYVQKLAALGINFQSNEGQKDMSLIAERATTTMGLASTLGGQMLTEKMSVWEPLEEAIYHLWVASNGELSREEFYAQERESAVFLTGTVEPYNRLVKNLPGDFLLRSENLPVAFLYSTSVDLQQLIGRNVTIVAVPRPNNNFAFPAYHVLSVE